MVKNIFLIWGEKAYRTGQGAASSTGAATPAATAGIELRGRGD
jgi:hypothetical protein